MTKFDLVPESPLSDPAKQSPTGTGQVELTVVVPTYNERSNVAPMVERLNAVLSDIVWEVIFVDDDSPDGTAQAVKDIAAHDSRVHCLHRVRRRGLAGAVIEGALASAAPLIAVMDGDLQHDEYLLPQMFAALQTDQVDLVVGSRYLADRSAEVDGLNARRQAGSHLANWLARKALSVDLSDPVSGFFMIRREKIDAVAGKLATSGFKVLFDIVASQPTPLRCLELPYSFKARVAGESKLDGGVVVQYMGLLVAKLSRDVISPRFLMFAMVGASGVIVHLAILRSLLGFGFAWAQFGAALGAMTSNYLINNAVTYRDRRKSGWGLISGYLKFCLLCSAPLAANVGVGTFVSAHTSVWWVAGIAGAVMGAVWNYVTTSRAVW